MMQWIIGLVLAVVLVVGGGYYSMSGGYTMSEDVPTIAVGEPSPEGDTVAKEYDKATPKLAEKAAAFTGSFFDLATRGGTYTCTISSSGTNNSSTGTVYVSGTNVRGDFISTTAGKTVDSSMLKLDDKVYVWGGGMTQGIVMDAALTATGSDAPAMSGSGSEMKQEYGWDCTATGADASKFVKPSNIEFMDLGAMMGGATGGAMPKMPTN
jgi:hypothetical protein